MNFHVKIHTNLINEAGLIFNNAKALCMTSVSQKETETATR